MKYLDKTAYYIEYEIGNCSYRFLSYWPDGTIIENNNGKNTINCQFDALKSFVVPFSKRILFLLPFISLPPLFLIAALPEAW